MVNLDNDEWVTLSGFLSFSEIRPNRPLLTLPSSADPSARSFGREANELISRETPRSDLINVIMNLFTKL